MSWKKIQTGLNSNIDRYNKSGCQQWYFRDTLSHPDHLQNVGHGKWQQKTKLWFSMCQLIYHRFLTFGSKSTFLGWHFVNSITNYKSKDIWSFSFTIWWRHQMETFSVLLALCGGNLPVTIWYPSQRPVMRSYGIFFYLRLNKRLNKQSRRRWFETPSRSFWRHHNEYEPKHAVCNMPSANMAIPTYAIYNFHNIQHRYSILVFIPTILDVRNYIEYTEVS